MPEALLLHGAAGGWDEIIVLALGIGLTFAVLRAISRRKRRGGRTEDGP